MRQETRDVKDIEGVIEGKLRLCHRKDICRLHEEHMRVTVWQLGRLGTQKLAEFVYGWKLKVRQKKC